MTRGSHCDLSKLNRHELEQRIAVLNREVVALKAAMLAEANSSKVGIRKHRRHERFDRLLARFDRKQQERNQLAKALMQLD